jgi:alkaline phosphatase D
MLGQVQWAWLEEQLRKPARIRLLVSSVQVVNDEHSYEGWGNFPSERSRLLSLIRRTGARGVVVLSGDRHFSEISREPEGAGYPLYDFTSSGLTERAEQGMKAPNSKRLGAPTSENSFGGVVVDWGSKDPTIRLEAIGLDGKALFAHTLSLSELTP